MPGSEHSLLSAISRHDAGEPASMQPAGNSGQRLLPLYGTDPGVGLMVSVSHHAQYRRQLMQSSGNRQRLGPYDCRATPWARRKIGLAQVGLEDGPVPCVQMMERSIYRAHLPVQEVTVQALRGK